MEDLPTPLQHYFLDASALVKLVCDEPGSRKVKRLKREADSPLLTSWVCVAEALGVLKRKWQYQKRKHRKHGDCRGHYDRDYTDKVQELLILVEHTPIRIVDLQIVNGEARLKTYPVDIADVRGRHPDLDAADALQFRAMKEGILECYSEEGKPQLVCADKKFLKAAKKDRVRTISVCKD